MNNNNEHIRYNKDMNERTVGTLLGDEFTTALSEGNVARLRDMLLDSRAKEIAQRYSVRMSAHDFLLEQKNNLVMINEQLNETTDLENSLRQLLQSMDESYTRHLVDPYEVEDNESKENYFQKTVKEMDDESLQKLAQHVATIDEQKLVPVDQIQDWIRQDARDSTVKKLWNVVQDYREQADVATARKDAHEAIANIVDDYDTKIIGSILY